MVTRISAWISEVNTTSLRIIASIASAMITMMAINIGILFIGWEPSPMQLKVMIGEAGVLLTMMGFDVIQFVGKRWTNSDYVAAKNQPTQVTVQPPSTVKVQGDAILTSQPTPPAQSSTGEQG